ncbi:hypothetical protein GGX14DRAFT_692025 [Mycena pura]|uniref:Secreted protein n=1 Tax=Mycena pura TaxID=153505 RepID=A0AAD7E5K0_9AGAR|nr:hypothetical protein GGX14DRAFT_692025 [Mycena pura]
MAGGGLSRCSVTPLDALLLLSLLSACQCALSAERGEPRINVLVLISVIATEWYGRVGDAQGNAESVGGFSTYICATVSHALTSSSILSRLPSGGLATFCTSRTWWGCLTANGPFCSPCASSVTPIQQPRLRGQRIFALSEIKKNTHTFISHASDAKAVAEFNTGF